MKEFENNERIVIKLLILINNYIIKGPNIAI